MPRYFFYYSGFSEGIPRADAHAVLRRHHYSIKTVVDAGRLEVIDVNPPLDFRCLEQCAFKNYAGELLGMTYGEINDTLACEVLVNEVDWETLAQEKGERSWCVRVKGDRKYFRRRDLKTFELNFAPFLYQKWKGPVKLKMPEVQFQIVLGKTPSGDGVMALGILQFKQPLEVKRRISRTLAGRRPIFHIGTMNNPIARFASNVAETPSGGILLDAFCGSGGILIEAALDGCYTIGIDVDYYFIRGVRLNMRYYAPDQHLGEIRASALALPIRSDLQTLGNSIRGVSSDLPYGRSTSRRGISVAAIWDGFLQELAVLIPPGTKCCLILPDTSEVREHLPIFAKNANFRTIETLKQYMHDSLTRVFLLIERAENQKID
ncbi:MAG TPA: hypothetical protein VKK79_18040 [Candidatus Lokiarchaeia archaeon]|nr:hypothetical protein [Candidatus Lokiarchaeia archaeon]